MGIVTYHSEVNASQPPAQEVGATVSVPTVKVRLVQSVKLPPKLDQSIVADVSWEGGGLKGPLLLEADPSLQLSCNVHVADTFVCQTWQRVRLHQDKCITIFF